MARPNPTGFLAAIVIGIAASAAQVTLATPENMWIWRLVTWISFAAAGVLGVVGAWSWFHGHGRPSRPDLTLSEFVMRGLGSNVADRDELPPEAVVAGIGKLFADVRQKARLDEITVWGRQDCSLGNDHIPLSIIPETFWESGEIDMLDYLRGGTHRLGTATLDIFKGRAKYTDLRFNKRQVARAWPRRFPKVRLQSPIVLIPRR